jgi:hypothetical protein
MKTSKHLLLAVAFVLLAGLGAGVMAQAELDSNLWQPPRPIVPIVEVTAIEVTDGTTGLDTRTGMETAFGYIFLGRTSGAMPGSFTLSMNCTPAIPMPGETSELTGGAWTLPVYMNVLKGTTGYAGALYGTIDKGTMNWDRAGTTANVYMVLKVDGGTQSWDNVSGYATFVGTLFVDEVTHKTTLSGELVFNIMTVVPD